MQSYSNIGGVSAFVPSRIEIRSEEAWEMGSYPVAGNCAVTSVTRRLWISKAGFGLAFRASALPAPSAFPVYGFCREGTVESSCGLDRFSGSPILGDSSQKTARASAPHELPDLMVSFAAAEVVDKHLLDGLVVSHENVADGVAADEVADFFGEILGVVAGAF